MMILIAFCNPDGSIHSIRECEEMPDETNLAFMIPEGGFFLDLTGQKPFNEMDILDIHNGYVADGKKEKLVKIKNTDTKDKK